MESTSIEMYDDYKLVLEKIQKLSVIEYDTIPDMNVDKNACKSRFFYLPSNRNRGLLLLVAKFISTFDDNVAIFCYCNELLIINLVDMFPNVKIFSLKSGGIVTTKELLPLHKDWVNAKTKLGFFDLKDTISPGIDDLCVKEFSATKNAILKFNCDISLATITPPDLLAKIPYPRKFILPLFAESNTKELLIVVYSDDLKNNKYTFKNHDTKMFIFNAVIRMLKQFEPIPISTIDGCFDCVTEYNIINQLCISPNCKLSNVENTMEKLNSDVNFAIKQNLHGSLPLKYYDSYILSVNPIEYLVDNVIIGRGQLDATENRLLLVTMLQNSIHIKNSFVQPTSSIYNFERYHRLGKTLLKTCITALVDKIAQPSLASSGRDILVKLLISENVVLFYTFKLGISYITTNVAVDVKQFTTMLGALYSEMSEWDSVSSTFNAVATPFNVIYNIVKSCLHELLHEKKLNDLAPSDICGNLNLFI
jgi:hypothetical protein